MCSAWYKQDKKEFLHSQPVSQPGELSSLRLAVNLSWAIITDQGVLYLKVWFCCDCFILLPSSFATH